MTEKGILVCYTKTTKDSQPLFLGFKQIDKEFYRKLVKDFITNITIRNIDYQIVERRWFKIEDNDVLTYYVIVDLMKVKK